MYELKRWRFRFLDADDQAKYGDGWYVWDEEATARRAARELGLLEAEIGVTIVRVIDGARRNSAIGNLAATWLSVRAVDPALAGPYANFSPLVVFLEWEEAPAEEPGVVAPLGPTPVSDSSGLPAAE